MGDLFIPILNQMIFLFVLIIIGFILSKWKFVPENSATVLSKLENIIFVPALVMGTFIEKCTLETLSSAWKLLLLGLILALILIPISLFAAKLCFKEKFLQNIAAYGLAFSNFAFMGNAIMSAVFPNIFFEYTIFTLPLWFMIYLWGAPVLLIGGSSEESNKTAEKSGKQSFASRMKAFINPMLIGMLIGMVIGLIGLKLPKPVLKVITVSGDCMSPIAMLLTGMTIAKINILEMLKKWRLYIATIVKLAIYPLIYILIFAFVPQNGFLNATAITCMMCVMCMPMGLNAIVIPAAYGKDTSDAAGLALISHLLSVISIPLFFMLFQAVVL